MVYLCNIFVERFENFIQSDYNIILIADFDNNFKEKIQGNEENYTSFTMIEQFSKELSESQKKNYKKYIIYMNIKS